MGHHGHHGGQGGGHNFGFGHPDQSPSWNSALQAVKEGSNLRNNAPSFMPVIGALCVFVIMFLMIAINWDAFVPDGESAPAAPPQGQPVYSQPQNYSQTQPQTQTYTPAYQPPPVNNQVLQDPQQPRFRIWVDR